MSQEVAAEYKSGKNDPARIAEKERYAKQVAARKRRKQQRREVWMPFQWIKNYLCLQYKSQKL